MHLPIGNKHSTGVDKPSTGVNKRPTSAKNGHRDRHRESARSNRVGKAPAKPLILYFPPRVFAVSTKCGERDPSLRGDPSLTFRRRQGRFRRHRERRLLNEGCRTEGSTRSDFLCPRLLHKPVSMRNLYRRKLVSILTCIHAMPPPYKLREAGASGLRQQFFSCHSIALTLTICA